MSGDPARAAVAAVVLASLVASSPSTAAESRASGSVQLVVERVRNSGPASFRLDLYLQPGKATGFVGSVATRLDARGRPLTVNPGIITSFNEHREPTAYASRNAVSTCAAGACETGSTPIATATVTAEDEGPSSTPTVVVVAHAQAIRWTFTSKGYRLRRARPAFRYVTGRAATSVGVDYVGMGAEAYLGGATLPGGPNGSLAVAAAPCSTSGSGVVSRGAGRVTLTGGRADVRHTCPADDGWLGAEAHGRTTWRLDGTVAGDQDFRGARLMVVDLPLR